MKSNPNPNPYKYIGPLDPTVDSLVCADRSKELDQVKRGINKGDFWSILGPRQMGRSTFLHLIEKTFSPHAYCLYFNLETLPAGEESFYGWLFSQIQSHVCASRDKTEPQKLDTHDFCRSLEELKPDDDQKKIILLFDEIEKIPSIKNFLHLWRKIYHQRNRTVELKRFSVVITGSAELKDLTAGQNSPFNIAEVLYLSDLSKADRIKLIDAPLASLDIRINAKVKEMILEQTSGHPQLTQQICHYLVKTAIESNREISEQDVGNAVDYLFNESLNLDMLRLSVESESKIKELLMSILGGTALKYHMYKNFSLFGTGPIVEDKNHCCTIRNKIYERFLWDILEDPITNRSMPDDRYKKGKMLGKGSMGIVYKAHDVVLDRTVALKMLTTPSSFNKNHITRFKKEASIAAHLSHPNIVTIYDFGETPTGPFIIMEHIEGRSLSDLIDGKSRLSFALFFYIAKALLNALSYSHHRGVIHRDIKPKNIVVTANAEVKMVDFGLAVLKEYHGNIQNKKIGTPSYMSPEQINGVGIDHRSDFYSLGVTFFHIITGEVPFKGADPYDRHLNNPMPDIRKIREETPPELENLIRKCTAKNKEDRFQSADEILTELKKIKLPGDGENVKDTIRSLLKEVDNDALDLTEAADEHLTNVSPYSTKNLDTISLDTQLSPTPDPQK